MSIDEKSIVQLLREDKQSIANLIETTGLDNVLDLIADAIEKEYCDKSCKEQKWVNVSMVMYVALI